MNLIICEKNIAAKRIASILSGGSSKQKKIGSVPVYDFSSNGMDWKVVGLRGHIINLDFPQNLKYGGGLPQGILSPLILRRE